MANLGWAVGGLNANHSERNPLLSDEQYLVAEILTCT